MRILIISIALITVIFIHAKAQDTTLIRNWYGMSASEIIFSGGQVKSNGQTLDNVVRFTVFFHFQKQYHYNFSNGFGLFTGFGVRNVGFINRVPVDSNSEATVKERSYSLGVPLALKVGNMKKGFYLATGAEAELMFAYKEKIIYNDQKTKNYDWFSDRVNLINPSVFADIRFPGGAYIRCKYYLLDFLKSNNDMDFIPPNYLTNTKVYYRPEESKLFYFAIGAVFKDRKTKKKHARIDEV